MAKSFRCRLITPDAQVLDAKASAAVIPAWDGQMGILPDRAAFVAKLGPGELRLDFPPPEPGSSSKEFGGGSRSYFVEGGFAHMVKNELMLLATQAIPAESLIEGDAQAELAEVTARKESASDAASVERLRAQRQRAAAKLRVARNFKASGSGI
ncbi:MAG: F0F1 ATP synthase subunit epsilon [Phycisphaerales bacterium]